ncbi:MAG: two pore domain potassium channel family protein [Planctomycetes bacterium]|nr:two pore domain potassium channel family protein [Planctomycetota bacterium]
MTAYGRDLFDKLTGPVGVFLISGSITLILCTAGLFLWAEGEANPRINGFFDALYLSVTTLTGVGYGDLVPLSRAGRVVAMAAMLGGTALFAGYTALIATAIIDVGRNPRWSGRGSSGPDRTIHT